MRRFFSPKKTPSPTSSALEPLTTIETACRLSDLFADMTDKKEEEEKPEAALETDGHRIMKHSLYGMTLDTDNLQKVSDQLDHFVNDNKTLKKMLCDFGGQTLPNTVFFELIDKSLRIDGHPMFAGNPHTVFQWRPSPDGKQLSAELFMLVFQARDMETGHIYACEKDDTGTHTKSAVSPSEEALRLVAIASNSDGRNSRAPLFTVSTTVILRETEASEKSNSPRDLSVSITSEICRAADFPLTTISTRKFPSFRKR